MITTNKKQKEETSYESPFFISYLITDPIEYGDCVEELQKNLASSFENHEVDICCFRDKETPQIENLAKTLLEVSRKFNIPKVLINSNIELAIKLQFDGVHLTSSQFDKIEQCKKQSLYTIISCHTENEIELAKKKGVDAVTYSPIFYKENKGSAKGCEELKRIVARYQEDCFRIIALGGIVSEENIDQVKQTNASGFASIRYFVD